MLPTWLIGFVFEGRWGKAYPWYDVDCGRYLPTCRDVLRDPENRHPEEIQAAVRLVAFLRVESEFGPIAKLAHHSEGNVRTQVARALPDLATISSGRVGGLFLSQSVDESQSRTS